MVQIVGFKERTKTEDQSTFFALILEGEIEMVKSQETGRMYATARRASITSTFNEETCKRLIGKTLPGSIKKIESTPYDYTLETGEVVTLNHSYEYQPEDSTEKHSMEKAVFQHSDNGAEKELDF